MNTDFSSFNSDSVGGGKERERERERERGREKETEGKMNLLQKKKKKDCFYSGTIVKGPVYLPHFN